LLIPSVAIPEELIQEAKGITVSGAMDGGAAVLGENMAWF
jgi:hypothetical protein